MAKQTAEESTEREWLDCLIRLSNALEVDEGMCMSVQGAAKGLIDRSVSSVGRSKLAKLGAVPLVLNATSSLRRAYGNTTSVLKSSRFSDARIEILRTLILLVKLLRNLCAGDSTNQDDFFQSSGVETMLLIRESVASIASGTCNSEDFSTVTPLVSSCLTMILQLLGNFAGRGDVAQATLWQRCFPNTFQAFAFTGVGEILNPLCMVIYTCCRYSSERRRELSSGAGSSFLGCLLTSLGETYSGDAINCKFEEDINWLELLIEQLCMVEPYFPVIFKSLGPQHRLCELAISTSGDDRALQKSPPGNEDNIFTLQQESLLGTLCHAFNNIVGKNSWTCGGKSADNYLPMPAESLCYLVDIIKQAAASAVKYDGAGPVPAWVSAPGDVRVLGLALSLTKVVSAWEHPSATKENNVHVQVTKILSSSGCIALLLNMVRVLGAPQLSNKGSFTNSYEAKGVVIECKSLPKRNPYQGYRRDIVATIANASYQSPSIQEEIRESGLLTLVLQQSLVETDNPFLREWSLWAMRNLLIDNKKNQQEIRELEMKEPVNLAELSEMGLGIEIDPQSRHPRLVNIPVKNKG